MTYSTAYPSPPVKQTSSHLRLVGEEEQPPYDAAFADAARKERRVGFVLMPADLRNLESCPVESGRDALPRGYLIAVYWAIAQYADTDGRCWPSIQRLANDLGWAEKTIRRAIKALAAAGLISIESRVVYGGMKQSNAYRLTKHKCANVQMGTQDRTMGTQDRQDGYSGPDGSVLRTDKQDPIEQESLEQDHPPTPQGGEPSRTFEPAPRATYIPTLGELYPKLRKAFKELDPAFTDGWLRTTLLTAEQEIGPLSYEALFEGVDAALRSVKRTLEAERKGGKPIGALTPYAKAIIVSTLKEQAHAAV